MITSVSAINFKVVNLVLNAIIIVVTFNSKLLLAADMNGRTCSISKLTVYPIKKKIYLLLESIALGNQSLTTNLNHPAYNLFILAKIPEPDHEEIGGNFEGDMILDDEQLDILNGFADRNGVVSWLRRWINHEVPFVIDIEKFGNFLFIVYMARYFHALIFICNLPFQIENKLPKFIWQCNKFNAYLASDLFYENQLTMIIYL